MGIESVSKIIIHLITFYLILYFYSAVVCVTQIFPKTASTNSLCQARI